MPTLITVPTSLDDQSFEQVLAQLVPLPPDEPLIVDARHCTFATAFGLPALLTLAQTRAEKSTFLPPDDAETARYWERAGFFRYAEQTYVVQGGVPQRRSEGENDLLMEVTRVAKGEDAKDVVELIQRRALRIFTNTLRLEPRSAMGLAMALSESCRRVVERADLGGWVMVQAYRYKKRLGARYVAVIALCDAGVGFTDGEIQVTEPARGFEREGIEVLSQYATSLEGKFSVRTGTARRSVVPQWDDDAPVVENLSPFPGAQLQLIIPERAAA